MGKLDGKVALVTGGSAGMGLATARLFASEGAKVIITGRSQQALDSAVSDCGYEIDAFCSDISVLKDIDNLKEYVERQYGKTDVIFANAGTGIPSLFQDTTEEDFNRTVNTNFKGTFFTIQKFLPLLQDGSSIVLNTSTLNQMGRAYVSTYSATKAAIRSLARSLTAELADRKIRVNALSPGLIDTEMAFKTGMSREMIELSNKQAHQLIPMHRSGSAAEIASAALFLASSDSAYISGVELCVDGGWSQV